MSRATQRGPGQIGSSVRPPQDAHPPFPASIALAPPLKPSCHSPLRAVLRPNSGATSKGGARAGSALDDLPDEIWQSEIGEYFEDAELRRFRAVCQAWRGVFSGDDLWLNKLTVLAAEHPALANLDAAEGESAMAWHARCAARVGDAEQLARRHRAGARPYLG